MFFFFFGNKTVVVGFIIHEIKTYIFKLFQRFLTELITLLLFQFTKMRTVGCVEIQKVT